MNHDVLALLLPPFFQTNVVGIDPELVHLLVSLAVAVFGGICTALAGLLAFVIRRAFSRWSDERDKLKEEVAQLRLDLTVAIGRIAVNESEIRSLRNQHHR